MNEKERLARYLDAADMAAGRGQERITSKQLAALVGVNETQIRRDLGYAHIPGKPGAGYDPTIITVALADALGILNGSPRPPLLVVAGRAALTPARVHESFHRAFVVSYTTPPDIQNAIDHVRPMAAVILGHPLPLKEAMFALALLAHARVAAVYNLSPWPLVHDSVRVVNACPAAELIGALP